MRDDPTLSCIILAEGGGTRLHELCAATCPAALPFCGAHRLIDWTLSNVLQSRIPNVTVATQYMPRPLEEHLAEVWAPRLGDGLRIANGVTVTGAAGGYRGTADALRHNLSALAADGATTVLIASADHIYDMDYGAMIAEHRNRGADVTVATTLMPTHEARAFHVVRPGPDGRVESIVEKPATPASLPGRPGHALASMGISLCQLDWLVAALAEAGDDFAHDILPRAVATGRAACHEATTPDGAQIYWRDVGTLDAYRATLAELTLQPGLCPTPSSPFDTVTSDTARRWARCGTVILPGGAIAPGGCAMNAIIGPGARLPRDEVIGIDPEHDRRWYRVTDRGTTLVTADMLQRRERRQRQVSARSSSPGLRPTHADRIADQGHAR